jgi:hypothetical protein
LGLGLAVGGGGGWEEEGFGGVVGAGVEGGAVEEEVALEGLWVCEWGLVG